MCMNHSRHEREAAMTIVEVIIAVLVITSVISAVALASASGNRLQGKARYDGALTATGARVLDAVSSNRGWMEDATCGVQDSPCNLIAVSDARSLDLFPAELLREDSVDGSFQLVSATSTALDSEVDGRGDDDRDGIVPDFFRLHVVIEPDADLVGRFGSDQARDFITTIDRNGDTQVGSLAVEVCRVLNQSDDRMTIQGCGSTSSGIQMSECPPAPRLGCGTAFDWVAPELQHDTNPSPFVQLARVPQGSAAFTLRNVTTNQSWSSSNANPSPQGLVFENLPSGSYRLEGLPASVGGGSERWPTKEAPTYHGTGVPMQSTISIEAGVRNRALVMYRPGRTGAITLRHNRLTNIFSVGGQQSRTEQGPWTPTGAYDESIGFLDLLCGMSSYFGGPGSCDPATTYEAPVGNCMILRFRAGATYEWSVRDPENEGEVITDTFNYPANAVRIRSCTEYQDTLQLSYHPVNGVPISEYPWGAVHGTAYSLDPKPDDRVTRRVGTVLETVMPTCSIPRRAERDCGIGPLVPGLNAGVERNGTMTSAQFEGNRDLRNTGPWIDGPLWVTPAGSIISSDGVDRGTNPVVTLTGTGECYWTGPNFSGRREGPCEPCNPLWRPGEFVLGACTHILTQIVWTRVVRETLTFCGIQSINSGPPTYYCSGRASEYGETVTGDFDLRDRPWSCNGLPAVYQTSPPTCRYVQPAPIPTHPHTSPASGAQVQTPTVPLGLPPEA
jgi:hypothetical protein